ncbi:unnamed protein product, partial [Adineta steineri]
MTVKNSSDHRKPNALDWAESSWLRWIHVAFWTWINPILTIGHKQQLTEDDLFEEKNIHMDTWKVLIKTFWKNWLFSGLILLPYIAAKIAQPLFLKEIILTINDNSRPSHAGYLYACGLGLSAVVQALIHQQYFFRITRIGSHARIGLSSIIYKRLLSLPISSMIKTTTGHIVNLILNDVGKFEELRISIHQIWAAPLEAIIV